MSSTNKTEHLKLNQWVASDKPKRSDFNYDNEILDTVLSQHLGDSAAHITAAERESWSSSVQFGLYFGNGETSRTLATDCPFTPKLAIVFAAGRPTSYVDFENGRKYNYLALASPVSASSNLALGEDGTLTVQQDIAPGYANEYTCLNQSGVSYTYILIR